MHAYTGMKMFYTATVFPSAKEKQAILIQLLLNGRCTALTVAIQLGQHNFLL